MDFLLKADSSSSFGETLAFGGEVVLVGILVVFAVLGLIWACLTIFKIAFYDLPSKRSSSAVKQAATQDEDFTPVTVASNDDEIVAVIAAAIAAAESEAVGTKFRVVSFRRK